MDRPEIKPNNRMFEVYSKAAFDHSDDAHRVLMVEFNKTDTEESHSEASEYNGFHYDVWINVHFSNGVAMKVTEKEFKNWFTFDPTIDGLWKWDREVMKVCAEWRKFLRCEKRDRDTYERLKRKFE